MILKSFHAEGFRNISNSEVRFHPRVNLLVGKNAEGKTNALEGIYFFSRGKSFRAKEERELVGHTAAGFRLKIEYEDRSGEGSLEYASFGRERLRKKNGYKVGRQSELIGSFVSVLFSPEDLNLVKGGPEERRQFLNVAVSQCYPEYISYYADFKRSLENRSSLLKSASKGNYIDDLELASWSETMAEYAAHIHKLRTEYIKRLNIHAKRTIREISSESEELELSYKSHIEGEVNDLPELKRLYRALLTESVEREKLAGTSLFGPQRDDIEIFLSGVSARSFASQGQQRSIVLALKLGEGEVIREIIGEYPVFLFDDVLSELDETRRKFIIGGVGERQIIITSCFEENLNDFADNIIRVSGGKYVSSYR
ncbi:MAG: DNA replication/repair protein RecF [Clostridia bacterium]|nr:DNA replication/repair protein RecF [Clostridia bacterium]